MQISPDLKDFDFFGKQKREAFYSSKTAISNLIKARDSWSLRDEAKIQGLLKISLWGNKCDLSISAGTSQSFHHDPLAQIENFKDNLLVDDSLSVVNLFTKEQILDIIMDNAGFEMLSDFCLADYLTSSGIVNK